MSGGTPWTAGPWFAGKMIPGDDGGEYISIGQLDLSDRPGRFHHYEETICEVWVNPNLDGDAQATARLIKAAPEMAEALQKAKQFIENGIEMGFIRMPDPETPDSAHDTLPLIRTLLTKIGATQ